MKKNSLPMAVLFQKRRYFLLGSHHLRDAALLKNSASVKRLGSLHSTIIACGAKHVQQNLYLC